MITTVKEPIVKTLGGAGLYVRDVKKMTDWYGKLMDMPTSNFDEKSPIYVFDMDNGVNLALDDYRNMKNLKKYPICQMKTGDIKKAYDLVQKSKIPLILDLQRPHPGLAYFIIEDSEGNAIMIVESDWINPNPMKPANPNHPIKNHLNTIVIPVQDLKRATEWYSKLLGYPIKPERQDGGPIYWFEMDNGTGLLLDDNRNNDDLDTYPTFMLKASNIHEAFAYIQEKEIEVVREIQFDHFFFIKDLEGNTVMICA
ncbi:VOC family protein [Salinibacillus xinjiangensis]|uniref:Glyoxalase/fosfomycin resistance/dioxygenase domain-containing protein n=1 Tax=Salinibacillus xinjiangensis TaxID=1229268 RepID=A0A6G1XA66_9BACI|nr:VOC family protein [Salinibacillus xinjiangensis]MRG87837.1 hypothetical protein [Salinibacillus xinjiangensis]